jgi:hypothetical protein
MSCIHNHVIPALTNRCIYCGRTLESVKKSAEIRRRSLKKIRENQVQEAAQ